MKKKPPINYTNRDFETINQELKDYIKRYYPNTFKDFSDAGFGSLMLDLVSLTGDQLAFYLDYQASESMFDSAIEYDNVVRHARSFGYKLQTNPSSYGEISLYVMVPALPSAIGPDLSYAPVLRRRTEFTAQNGNSYLLLEDVDFSDTDKVSIRVGRVNDLTGLPTYYAIKAKGRIVSGQLAVRTFQVGNFEKFRKLSIGSNRVAEIISVFDASGNEYFEVEHLAQNVIYRKILNTNEDRWQVPNILKPIVVQRRFTVEREGTRTFLQFGHGSDENNGTVDVLDPANTVLNMFAKNYVSDTNFDPTVLISNDKFGVAPSNTTLTVVFRENTTDNVNAATSTVRRVSNPLLRFRNTTSLSQDEVNFVTSTLECNNDIPVRGDVSLPNTDEIKIRATSYFSTQKRCVTVSDYKSMVYAMPPAFGAVKRVNVFQDKDSFKRNLNLYVISEDENGNLIRTPNTLKSNIKEWLSQHKMVNDSIDIMDARIVNFGIKFKIVSEPDKNKYDVLQRAINVLRNDITNKMEIGEPILISHFYNILNEVEGVEDVVDVQIVNRRGSNYSTSRFDFDANTSPDGRMIRGYENVVFELKFPVSDIEGSIL